MDGYVPCPGNQFKRELASRATPFLFYIQIENGVTLIEPLLMPTDHLFRFADGRFRVDLDLLYPPFLSRLLDVLAACQQRGASYYVVSGTRRWSEQLKLHQAWLAGGPRAAAPGLSSHAYGIAVDVTFDCDPNRRGLQPRWNVEDYAILVEEVERAGLHSGHGYQDYPHVSLPGFVTARDLKALRRIYEATDGDDRDRLRAVWAYLDG